ncbi:MAG: M20 family metallopeptidase [Armatimonadota bacterium]
MGPVATTGRRARLIMTPAEIASQLVAIPSPNLGQPGADPPSSCEQEVARFVVAFLEDLGLAAERQPVVGERCNILATIEGTGPRTLLIDAHMDTVPAENMDIEPFSGEVRDGKVFGRGACDNKGSLTAVLTALRDLVEGDPPSATVRFAATVDEEVGFRGMRRLAQSGLSVDAAIVAEPTRLEVVVATKGAARWKVRTRGIAAHTSQPELGVNAIYKMAEVVSALHGRLTPALAERRHPLVGCPKLTVSVIEGGRLVNIVPDECVIEVDRRLLPGEQRNDVIAEVQKFLADLRQDDPQLDVRMEDPYLFLPGTEVLDTAEIVRVALEAATELGGGAETRGVPFTSHASVLEPVGIPAILFGPGNADLAHGPVEYVEIEKVERAAQAFARIARRFGACE